MKKACIQCGEQFEFRTHNQKYCSNHCCRIATNKRIMDKYYEKKERLKGKTKFCKCGAMLSRYSNEVTCITCQGKKRRQKTSDAVEAMKNAAVKASKTKSR